jgi:hypothetical protein
MAPVNERPLPKGEETMTRLSIVLTLLALIGCSSSSQPVVKFRDPKTGAVTQCGGAIAWIGGGWMGGLSYDHCLEAAKEQNLERLAE